MKKIIFLILFFSFLAFGQNFTASVSKNPVVQGERFEVRFSVNANASGFKAPNFIGFKVLSGPSQSQSMQFINGRSSVELSFSYVLLAENVGEFYIGPASINVDGKEIKSQRLKIKVAEPSQAEKQRRAAAKQQEQDLQKQANKVIKDNLYLKIKMSKSSAFIGEQILVTYELYANDDLNIVNLELSEMPNFNGFWTQDFDREARWEATVENGVRFRKAVIRQVLLYPQQSGNLKLEPMIWNAIVRLRTSGSNQRRRRSIFDDFFDRGSYKDFNYTVNSGTRNITIKDLPDPKPLSFFGAVGDYTLDSWVDKTELKTGETLNLKVKLEGQGNMKLLSAPEFEFPPGFELFEPKLVDNSQSSVGGTSGNIVFEYLMIPRNEGTFKIPSQEYTVFNPQNGKYQTLKTNEFEINVAKGDGSQNQTVITGVNKEDVKYLGKDIRFIKLESNLQKGNYKFFGSIIYWLLILFGLFLLIILIFVKRKNDSDDNNQDALKIRRAKKVARKRLVEAKKHLDSNQKDKFIEEIIKVLWGYISDKLNIPVSDLNKDAVSDSLNSRGVNLETSKDIIGLIETCEFSRYAPSSEENNPENIYKRSSNIITKIEEELK
jgi:uncharacterized membrane protein